MATVYTNVKNNTGIFYNDNTLSLLKLATGQDFNEKYTNNKSKI